MIPEICNWLAERKSDMLWGTTFIHQGQLAFTRISYTVPGLPRYDLPKATAALFQGTVNLV